MSNDENQRQSQEMEMYMQIAHDVNNLLTAIIGFSYLLTKQTSQNTSAQDIIEGRQERRLRLRRDAGPSEVQ